MTLLAVPPEVWWWLGIAVALAGVVVAALHVRDTRWAILLLAAFAVEMLVATFYRVATGPTHREVWGLDIYFAQRAVSLLGLCGRIAMVIGIAGVLNVARLRAVRSRPWTPS